MDLQGNIENFSLPEILQLIASSRKSGTLGIQKDDSIVMVYFQAGDIIYGYGPRQTYHLGQLLKERGKLTSEQLTKAIRAQEMTDNSRRLGEILISHEFIDRADLEAVVRDQVEELLYSLLSWKTGSFKFYEKQFPTDEEITVRLSAENVILEGLRRIDEQELINKSITNLDAIYTIATSESGRSRAVTMQASEWNIMAMIDGYRTVNQVCQLNNLPQNETLFRLARLKMAGIIVESEAKSKPVEIESELDGMISRLASLFENYLTNKTITKTTGNRLTKALTEEPANESN